jgi:hypothetical protein
MKPSFCIYRDIIFFILSALQLELSSSLLSSFVKFMFVKSDHHTRQQEERKKSESQIFEMTPRFEENWSHTVVTI